MTFMHDTDEQEVMLMQRPRYSRVSDLLELLITIERSSDGITLQYVIDEFGVSRRTAERMLKVLREIDPNIVELDYILDSKKHYGYYWLKFKLSQ